MNFVPMRATLTVFVAMKSVLLSSSRDAEFRTAYRVFVGCVESSRHARPLDGWISRTRPTLRPIFNPRGIGSGVWPTYINACHGNRIPSNDVEPSVSKIRHRPSPLARRLPRRHDPRDDSRQQSGRRTCLLAARPRRVAWLDAN